MSVPVSVMVLLAVWHCIVLIDYTHQLEVMLMHLGKAAILASWGI